MKRGFEVVLREFGLVTIQLSEHFSVAMKGFVELDVDVVGKQSALMSEAVAKFGILSGELIDDHQAAMIENRERVSTILEVVRDLCRLSGEIEKIFRKAGV